MKCITHRLYANSSCHPGMVEHQAEFGQTRLLCCRGASMPSRSRFTLASQKIPPSFLLRILLPPTCHSSIPHAGWSRLVYPVRTTAGSITKPTTAGSSPIIPSHSPATRIIASKTSMPSVAPNSCCTPSVVGSYPWTDLSIHG